MPFDRGCGPATGPPPPDLSPAVLVIDRPDSASSVSLSATAPLRPLLVAPPLVEPPPADVPPPVAPAVPPESVAPPPVDEPLACESLEVEAVADESVAPFMERVL